MIQYISTLAKDTPEVYVDGDFVWKSYEQMNAFRYFRYTLENQLPRRPEQIPDVEVGRDVMG